MTFTSKNRNRKKQALESIAPGELLEEELLKLMGISKYRLAKEISVSAGRIR